MQHEIIADLMVKHMQGIATAEEAALLNAWKDEKPDRRKQVESWANPETLQRDYEENLPGADSLENMRGRLHRIIKK